MKKTIQILSLALAAIWLASANPNAYGRDGIVYVSGPSFPFPYWVDSDGTIDLNGDGTPDFSFQLGAGFGTGDFFGTGGSLIGLDGNPISGGGFYAPYTVWGLGTNSTLFQRFGNGTVLPFGTFIGNPPPTNSIWSSPDPGDDVATLWIGSGQDGLHGPLADVGVGYIGVRFYAADGWHYGWVRVRSTPVVEVVDWAYESRPDTAIHAGVIGTADEARQFTVNFENGGTGSLILIGNTLRCELDLAGEFTSANLGGPAPAHAQAKPVADLGSPLVTGSEYTSFFRDVSVSRADVTHLLQGKDHVSLDGGLVVGSVSPFE